MYYIEQLIGEMISDVTMKCVLLSRPGTLQVYPNADWMYWIPEQNTDPDGSLGTADDDDDDGKDEDNDYDDYDDYSVGRSMCVQ